MLTEDHKFAFGSLFLLANRVQLLGDKIDPDISIKQWLFIVVIPSCGSAPTIMEISRALGSSHQNVKKMAVILESRGFIRLFKDPEDARITRVSLTEKCAEFFDAREDAAGEFIERLFAGFSDSEIRGLSVVMRKLSENVVAMEAENDNEKREL